MLHKTTRTTLSALKISEIMLFLLFFGWCTCFLVGALETSAPPTSTLMQTFTRHNEILCVRNAFYIIIM